MPLVTLFDIGGIDLTREVIPVDEIRRYVPHRHEFALLDGIVHFDDETMDAVGYHDTRTDAFWVRGHIPGDPIFPGALMVETAAQLSSFCYGKRFGINPDRFFGFGGIDKVKFRSMVRPGQRLYVLCKEITLDRRYSRFAVQGICEGRSCFEGEIIGVAMPRAASSGAAQQRGG
jgi:3-hydroxyacyl-[acyl-carrier-protein] dehydratase